MKTIDKLIFRPLFFTIFLLIVNMNSKAALNSKISVNINSLNITIDERIELLTIVQYLGNYNLLNEYPSDYKEAIDQYFIKSKNAEVISFFAELTKVGFSYDVPVNLMLYLSDSLTLEKELPEELVKRAGGTQELYKFIYLLREFSKETSFHHFFQNQSTYYWSVIKSVVAHLKDFDEIYTIEDYYGIHKSSYNIILSLLQTGFYGLNIPNSDNFDVYNVMSPVSFENGELSFGTEDHFRYIVWHEFGHSFINHLTNKYSEKVKKYEQLLYNPIKASMSAQAYKDWITVVNEHIIRAISIRLESRRSGVEKAKSEIQQEVVGRSFIYIEPICEQLQTFESNREQYKTFDEFFPMLLDAFEIAGEKDYSSNYLGNLNFSSGRIDYIIISSHETDSSVQNELNKFVDEFRNMFFYNTPIITDEEALKWDMSKSRNLIVFGTIDGNKWLSVYKELLPIKIDSGKIIADKEYKGTSLRAIFNFYNPKNQHYTVKVYTAQRTEDIIKINQVFHGPTNYVIAMNKDILKAGYYTKTGQSLKCD